MNHRIFIRTVIAATALLSLPAVAEPPVALAAADRAFVEAFNQGEREVLTAYVRRHFSAEALARRDADARVDDLLNLHQRFGALTPQEVSEVSRVTVVGAAAGRAPQGADIVVLHDGEHPERIADLWIHATSAEVAQAP